MKPSVFSELSRQARLSGINYTLEAFSHLLEALGNPQLSLSRIVHIAGTNGKGSTLAYLASILKMAGYRVGTYTSPHLYSYCERIQVNSQPISISEFEHLYARIVETGCPFTEFEALTAMAFLSFQTHSPDFILLETGLGGRLDATNLCSPDLCLITKIDLDHEAILGTTLPKIALEKAGIIKPGIPIFTTQSNTPDVLDVLSQTAHHNHSPFSTIPPLSDGPHSQTYQAQNLALAQAAARHLVPSLSLNHIQKGSAAMSHWGRLTHLEYGHKTLYFEAAHNPAGMRASLQALQPHLPPQDTCLIFGVQNQKNIQALCQILDATPYPLYYCAFDPTLSYSFETVHSLLPRVSPYDLSTFPSVPTSVALFTGSIYFLGHLYPKINNFT